VSVRDEKFGIAFFHTTYRAKTVSKEWISKCLILKKPHTRVSFLNFVSVSLLRTNIYMQFSFIFVFVQEIAFQRIIYRIIELPQKFPITRLFPFLSLGGLPKTSQNLSVSSAAADTTQPPSGL